MFQLYLTSNSLVHFFQRCLLSSYNDNDELKTARYYPATGEFGPYYDMEDLSDTHDNPSDTGGLDEEEEHEVNDTDDEKGFLTIAFYKNDKPSGLAWQWKSERVHEGFLYGKVDKKGEFTGDDILYIYPDFETGLRGTFRKGQVCRSL